MNKRFVSAVSTGFLALALLAGCGNGASSSSAGSQSSKTKLDTLNVAFVPSRDPEEIVTATEPLKGLLKDEMAKQGYEVGTVNITVGTSYDGVGEALSSGQTDVGLIPGGTFTLYEQDGVDVLLTATREGLSKNFENPKDWNDGKATTNTDKKVTFYKGLVIAGPTEKGKELAAKVNSGEKLTWEDLNSANWAVMGTSSSSGYIYPTLWLQKNFGHSISELSSAVQSDSYGSSFARLASGQVDILVAFADARMDYAKKWNEEYSRTGSIWEETNVIGVTDDIYNDTVSVRNNMDDKLREALSTSFINIGNTEEGQKVIKIYNHKGYQKAQSSDYDNERAAQKAIKGK